MEIAIITFLLILGLILIVAEILIIPGITVAAFMSLASFATAIVMVFKNYGLNMALVVLSLSIVLSIVVIIVCLQRKALKKITLDTKIDSTIENKISSSITLGETVKTQTRLAPMGSIITTKGEIFEAKSISGYVSENITVEVVDIENGIAIVKTI
ncbi:MAG: NfeD family protein [Rikenellaceae bacterium]